LRAVAEGDGGSVDRAAIDVQFIVDGIPKTPPILIPTPVVSLSVNVPPVTKRMLKRPVICP
jgi:hypothetical protein